MSITKLAIGTYIDYAPKDPATITDRAPINIGTKEVQNIPVGGFVLSTDDTWNKVLANTPVSGVAVKQVVLKSGLSITIAGTDSITPGDSVTTVTGTQEVLHVTALPDTSSVYSITTEGAKSIIANSFVINSIPV
tara:strand:- start:2742 stop:3146 length:405 start_codon:yes stop_codon:yes gene_type:complete